jgi:rod shape-determining protein MreD
MIYYGAVPLTIAMVVLQMAASPAVSLLGVHADLVVVWLGCWAAIRGKEELMVLIPVAGIGLGLLGREPLGASLLALMPLAGLAALTELRIVRTGFTTALFVVFFGALCFTVVHAVAGLAGGEGTRSIVSSVRIAPRAAVLDSLTCLIWYWPMRLVFKRRTYAGQFRRA